MARPEDSTFAPLLLHQAADAKSRQNLSFKRGALIVVAAGAVGFAPSLYKAAATGTLWSVSHDQAHTRNDYLVPHLIGMLAWLLALFVQFTTGGLEKWAAVHRACGYLGAAGLLVGMVFAVVNELEYDSGGGLVYTLTLAVGATLNLCLGIWHARSQRYAQHKDHLLLSVMFTLDPAIHRLAMWIIRWIAALHSPPLHLDPILLLILGKVPTNLILFSAFGFMLVYGRRLNRVTAANLAFNPIALLLVSLAAFTASGSVSTGVQVGVAAVDFVFVVVFAALVVLERRCQQEEQQHLEDPLGPKEPLRA